MTKITIDRETVEQALKALEVATTPLAKDRQEVLRAQAAIKEALAEPAQKQEPVAWIYEFYADMGHKGLAFEEQPSAHNTPLYTHPPVIDKSAAIRIATALGWEPKREWVGAEAGVGGADG